MHDLLKFLITKITGSDKFEIEEENIDGRVGLTVKADKDIIGLIIGKEGKTIKTLRKILSVPAVIAQTSVNISVVEQ
ncbi:MAG: KH domain-containing protein [Patescibacteria group bacterium]